MSYEKLTIEEFGGHLLNTNDLDPIYLALYDMRSLGYWEKGQLARWLVAYWCFYHAGLASYLCEFKGQSFWQMMQVAAINEQPTPLDGRWPRGSERRHFRGKAGITAVRELSERYREPEKMLYFIGTGENDYKSVAKRVKMHRGFGPWMAFKVCDMLDRVLQWQVNFDQAAVFMFDDPVKAAIMLWRQKGGYYETVHPKDKGRVINEVVEYLINYFKDRQAPPAWDRPIGLQEVETILCKWKSHMNGHYPLNNDIDEIMEGLTPWAVHSATAKEFMERMPGDLQDVTY